MYHEPEDAHHRGTALIELDGALAELRLLVEAIPSEVESTVAEISREVPGGRAVGAVLHDPELEHADEGDDLPESGSADGIGTVDRRPSVGIGIE